jgi:SAM-dependent methyltransferase
VYWGVEPDATTPPEEGLFDEHQVASAETAHLPRHYFDVVYAYMVMEHVTDPTAFMRAVWRSLRPSGSFLFATPNGRHYFTRTAHLLRALHVDEAALRIIRRRSLIESYHYPVQYRFNRERSISRCCRQARVGAPEFAYLEADGPRSYMRGPLQIVFHLLALKRYLIRNPRSLISMIGRIRKPD